MGVVVRQRVPEVRQVAQCQPVSDMVRDSRLRTRPKFIVVLYRLQCRSHRRPGSDLREGQAQHGYEWSRTTSIR